MLGRVFSLAACILLFFGQACLAEISDDDIMDEVRVLKEQIKKQEQRISELEEKLSEQETKPAVQLADGAINMKAGATFVIQGTDNANGDNLSQKGEDTTDASYSINLIFEKEFEDYGKAFMEIETGDGAGVEDELQLFSNVNKDADDSNNSMAVSKVWYEHYFSSAPVSLMAGKIDPGLIDTNEYANDECTQFLGRMFKQSPTIEFPDNGAGMRLKLEPSDFADMQLLMMDGDNDWEDVVDDGFYAVQLNIKPGFLGRTGNYRVLYWLSNREHTKWSDSGSVKEDAYGAGVSFDQELTDTLGAFLRYGWQDPDVYLNGESFSLEHAWSAGIQLAGTNWGREEDILGLAIGQAMPSGKYEDAGTNLDAENEGHFEAYYNYKVNEHLTLTPDVQVIWNPYGDDATNGNDTVTVVGMRGQVDF